MPMLPYTATTMSQHHRQHLVPRCSESPDVPSKFHNLRGTAKNFCSASPSNSGRSLHHCMGRCIWYHIFKPICCTTAYFVSPDLNSVHAVCGHGPWCLIFFCLSDSLSLRQFAMHMTFSKHWWGRKGGKSISVPSA